MGEAEEVERLRLAKPCPLPLLRRPAAELDQTGLVRMQGQRKLRQPIPQFRLEPLGIGLVLKAGNDVVGIAHQDDVSLGMVASPPLGPQPAIRTTISSRCQRSLGLGRHPRRARRRVPAGARPCFSWGPGACRFFLVRLPRGLALLSTPPPGPLPPFPKPQRAVATAAA